VSIAKSDVEMSRIDELNHYLDKKLIKFSGTKWREGYKTDNLVLSVRHILSKIEITKDIEFKNSYY